MSYAFLIVSIFAVLALLSISSSIGKIADAWKTWIEHELDAAEEEAYRQSFTGPTGALDADPRFSGATGAWIGPSGPNG